MRNRDRLIGELVGTVTEKPHVTVLHKRVAAEAVNRMFQKLFPGQSLKLFSVVLFLFRSEILPDSTDENAWAERRCVAAAVPAPVWTTVLISGPHVDSVTLLAAGAPPDEPGSSLAKNLADQSHFEVLSF